MKPIWKYLVLLFATILVSITTSVITFRFLESKTQDECVGDMLKKNTSGSYVEGLDNLPSLTHAAQCAIPAVVHIRVVGEQEVKTAANPFEILFGSQDYSIHRQPTISYGSGVIFSVNGYVLTNYHVIKDAKVIQARLNDNRTFQASIVGVDKTTDLALLKLKNATNLPTIPMGNSNDIKVGEWVLAVGNPFNLTSTVTAGIISAKARNSIVTDEYGNVTIESFIQTDAAINPGNSGGALVNASGELIGINTMIYSKTGSYSGYSFAIPISMAKKIASDLKEYGEVKRAYLGVVIKDVSDSVGDNPPCRGALVESITSGSAADKAKIKAGDIITSFDGKKIDNAANLQEMIALFSPGQTIKLIVNRNGKTIELKAQLQNNNHGGKDLVRHDDSLQTLLGASFVALNDGQKSDYGISFGIQVKNIKNGILKEVGMRDNFIILTANNEKIYSINSLKNLINKIKNNPHISDITLHGIYPNGGIMSYRIDLD